MSTTKAQSIIRMEDVDLHITLDDTEYGVGLQTAEHP